MHGASHETYEIFLIFEIGFFIDLLYFVDLFISQSIYLDPDYKKIF